MAIFNADGTVTVEAGDTPIGIANKLGMDYKELCRINNIKEPYTIYVGQVLKTSGTPAATKPATSSKVTVVHFGLESETASELFITWNWDREHTKEYKVRWKYYTADKIWFDGQVDTVAADEYTARESHYAMPSNADIVKVTIKPIAESREVNGTDTPYWTADWSTDKQWHKDQNPPGTPNAPSVQIKELLLIATVNDLQELNADVIHFQVWKDNLVDPAEKFITSKTTIDQGDYSARYSCKVSTGYRYHVRCQASRGELYSEWSKFTYDNLVAPSAPATVTTCRANSETTVYLEWPEVGTAEYYEIQYTTEKNQFDIVNGTTTTVSTKVTGNEAQSKKTSAIITVEPGSDYFFRVRAVNSAGESGWSGIKSVAIGKRPAAPTTWSSTVTAVAGEDVNLYWIHNAEDDSPQTYADIELYVNDQKIPMEPIKNPFDEDGELSDKTSVYTLSTGTYDEGAKIKWRVRTAGITKEYGDWSVQRTIDVYNSPVLQMNIRDNKNSGGIGNDNSQAVLTLTSFPLYIEAEVSNSTATHTPVGYYLSITADEAYESTDNIGNTKMVSAGQSVYAKQFDISSPLEVTLSAHDMDLENNVSYTVHCTVSMNSGLSAEAVDNFEVAWTDEIYEPNAEIGIDMDTLTANIRPYCTDENEQLVEGVTLSVYRREFDGSFTEIVSKLPNAEKTYVVDPHPALDFARYRVVATSDATGAVSYYDVPGQPVGEKAVVIQWDEAWTRFDVSGDDLLSEPSWAGSMLKLPYNIDVSDKYAPDVTLVKYIGRKRPVSYYGTHHGESSSWSVAIDKKDTETLYALRRLAIYMGDVYVREPSGSGYWANIVVSFGQRHLDLTIPVTLSIVRVEGGM